MTEKEHINYTIDKVTNEQPSLSGFVNAERDLFSSLKQNFAQSFKDNLDQNWPNLVIEGTVGAVAGAALAATSKNPALVGRVVGKMIGHENPLALGDSLVKYVQPTISVAPWALGALALGDVANRLASPGLDLMVHPDHRSVDEKQFASNVSSTAQDYVISGLGGITGAGFAWKSKLPFKSSKIKLPDLPAGSNWYQITHLPSGEDIVPIDQAKPTSVIPRNVPFGSVPFGSPPFDSAPMINSESMVHNVPFGSVPFGSPPFINEVGIAPVDGTKPRIDFTNQKLSALKDHNTNNFYSQLQSTVAISLQPSPYPAIAQILRERADHQESDNYDADI